MRAARMILVVTLAAAGCGRSNTAPNRAPVAVLGPDVAGRAGEAVGLDGSRSFDPDGDALLFRWRVLVAPAESADPTVRLSLGADRAYATLVPDAAGLWVVALWVSDGRLESEPAAVAIEVSAGCRADSDCAGGGSFCAPEKCRGGACVAEARDCGDGDACTNDECSEGTRRCRHTRRTDLPPEGPYGDASCTDGVDNDCDGRTDGDDTMCKQCRSAAECDDRNVCTGEERCSDGNCAEGEALDCDDGNVCTEDECLPAVGCHHVNTTSACDDGDACTMSDACRGGSCVGAPLDADGDGYVSDACGGNDCDDGDPSVHPGAAEGPFGEMTCGDGEDNDCDGRTDGQDTGCHQCGTNADCDDQDVCNGHETCMFNRCMSGMPLNCDDGNVCTFDTCQVGVGCRHANVYQCDDGDICTQNDHCEVDVCLGDPISCDDGDSCTTDRCVPGVGCVFSLRDLDGDGYVDAACDGSDCNDQDPLVHPGAQEGPIGDSTCSDRIDNDCDQQSDSSDLHCNGPDLVESPVVDGYVMSAVVSEGIIHIGGDFRWIGPRTGSFVCVNKATGMRVPNWPQVDGTVYAIAKDGNGGWFIGGDFLHVNGLPRSRLAHILADGRLAAWNPAVNGRVSVLKSDSTGAVLYVGGTFSMVAGTQRMSIAAIDIGTGQVTNWQPRADGQVYAIDLDDDLVFVGGTISTVNGEPRRGIAAIKRNTGDVTGWNPGVDGNVYAIKVMDHSVYLGGDFNTVSGRDRNGIAEVDKSTGLPTPWYPIVMGKVLALQVSGSYMYAGGDFSFIHNQPSNSIAVIDMISGETVSFPQVDGTVEAVLISGELVYFGGWLRSVGGNPRQRIAAVNIHSGMVTEFNPNANGIVEEIVDGGDRVCYGGSFTSVNGVERSGLAAFDIDKNEITPWAPLITAENQQPWITALALNGDTVYVAGTFTGINGIERNGLAAVDKTTGQVATWNSSNDGYIQELVTTEDSVLVGGDFTNIGWMPRRSVAALDKYSGVATSWNPDPDQCIHSIYLSGTSVFLGGSMNTVYGLPRTMLAEVNKTTGQPTDWSPMVNGSVQDCVAGDSVVYVVGSFSQLGNQRRLRIGAISRSTGQPTTWNPNGSYDNWFGEITINDNKIYVGGAFSSIGGKSRRNLAALDPDNGVATGWDPGPNSNVKLIEVSGEYLLVGGNFVSIAGWPQQGIAIFR